MTAAQFVDKLIAYQARSELVNVQRFFNNDLVETRFIGVKMSNIFKLAKAFTEMPPGEIEHLLKSEFYEARMGAVCIMDFQARLKNNSSGKKKQLFDMYISNHGCINNWDMVDRGAPYIVGGYLYDKPRKVLYKLARSKDPCERRTAIVATYFFIRQNDLDDTFRIAALLIRDKNELVNKAVGSWIREAGKRDQRRLLDFLDRYALKMPRVTLRYATEKLDRHQREHYLSLK